MTVASSAKAVIDPVLTMGGYYRDGRKEKTGGEDETKDGIGK